MLVKRLMTLIAALAMLSCGEARAHEGRPLFVQIVEQGQSRVSLSVSVPPSVPDDNRPELALAGACQPVTAAEKLDGVSLREFICAKPGLQDAALNIHFPHGNPAVTTLVLARLADGSEMVATVPPGTTRYSFGASRSSVQVAGDYTRLGIEHILGGIDHLLFVFGLFLLSRNSKQLLIVLTGFTVAHSLTLTAATLGWVNVPIPPTEAVIALSIVFVAREVLRTEDSLAKRLPVVVSFAFGLLHGFGFASVLSDTGLPRENLLTALVFFNVGVELGQIAFVLVLVAMAAGLRAVAKRYAGKVRSLRGWPVRQTKWTAYALGAVSAMWFLERTVEMFA